MGIVLEHIPTKVPVIARRGARYLHSRTDGNRELIIVIATTNAAGKASSPHLIMKRKTRLVLNGFDSDKAPEGTKQGIDALWFTDDSAKYWS